MTRETVSSRKSAVVLSPDGEVEGHIIDDNNEAEEKISPEREIVYVPYESVGKSSPEQASAATPNYRSTIILSNLLVAALVALYFHFAGPSSSDNDHTTRREKSASVTPNFGKINKIDRSDQVDDSGEQFPQTLELLKSRANNIIIDRSEDISLVNDFLDSWRDIAPSTKQSFKNSDWFKQFSQSLNNKIDRIRNISTYNESSQIYAGTLLNLSALLGIQTTINTTGDIANSSTTAVDDNSLSSNLESDDKLASNETVASSAVDQDNNAMSQTETTLANADSASSDTPTDGGLVKGEKADFSDIVSELSSQIAKLDAEQKNQVEDESLHQADLVKNSHSVIGNTVKSDNGYSESDLHYLLGQYATTYEFGDTKKLLALFDAESDYRKSLNRSFRRVFARSENRHIEFSNLEWKFYKNSIIGNGKYKAVIKLKKDKGTRYVNAEIRVKMLAHKNSLKIARLDFSKVKSHTVKPGKSNKPDSSAENTIKPISKPRTRTTIGKAYESIPKNFVKPKGPTAAELQDVITRFIGAYESGNIKALDGIFSLNARTNERNNLREIKSDYKTFFSHTRDRQLYIKDLKWTINKELAKGVGNLNALVVKTDSDKINAINGEVEIVAKRIHNKVLITHLFHNYTLSKK